MKAQLFVISLVAATIPTGVIAQPANSFPVIIPSPGGQVAITSQPEKQAYDDIKFAPARRAGDWVFVSGEVVGPQGFEGENIDAFREQSRRTFRTIGDRLKALGASFKDVVMIHSYHRFSGPGFSGGKWDQFSTFSKVKDEFMPPPHPAWTAVGVAELIPGRGVIEVEMLAYAPLDGKKSR